MSKFTEKLNSSELVSNAINEIDKDQADVRLLIDTIRSEFKDWQPPKPLVVAPQFVADWLDYKGAYIIATSPIPKEVLKWSQGNTGFSDVAVNISNLIEIKVTGYTVEKEKLYRLKNKITNQHINMNPYNGHCHESMTFGNCYKCVFTQSEIDDMETGSYEKIEVEP